jgi:hypothetical protein
MPWTATFLLATLMVPFENGQLEPYVQQLCQQAKEQALPANVPSSTALQSAAVCLFAYSDMVYGGQPTKSCSAVVAALKPDDSKAAMDVCEAAGEITRDWASGRF